MSDLAQELVDAAAQAIGDAGYAATAAVVAVLETLAIEYAPAVTDAGMEWRLIGATDLHRMVAEVRELTP